MPDDLLSSGYDDILSQVGNLSKEIGKTTAPEEARMGALAKEGDKARADLTKAAGEAPPKIPGTPELPKRPEFRPTGPMEALGNPLVVASIFASALTHAPLTTALNAAGSAFKGYHDGNLEAAEQAERQYKDAMESVLKQHELEMEQYRALIEEHGQTIKGKAAVLEAIGSAYGWTNELRLAKAGRVDEALKIIDAKERMLERLRGKTVQEQLLHQWEALHKDATPEEKVKFLNSMRVGTSPQARMLEDFREDFEAKNGRPPSPQEEANFMQTLRPPRSPAAMYMQKWSEAHPDASPEEYAHAAQDYGAQAKAVSAFAAGKQGDILRSFDTVAEHLGTLDSLVDALNNSDNVTFNRIANSWATEFNISTAPNNFNSAKQIIGDEIVKAIVGAGGGVTDRDKAQAVIDAAKTPQELKEAIGTLRELIGGQVKGLRTQWEFSTGRSGEEFDARLTGAAKSALTGTFGKKKRYKAGDFVDTPKGKARVTGGDPEDPEVELVK